MQALNLIKLVEDWQQKYVFVTYPSLSQTGSCEQCLGYEADVMTKTEIYNAFSDYLEDFGDKILPHVHPNCKCELHMVDIEIPPEIKKLPDDQFNDWLGALLSGGIIALDVYDLIMARRKKKKAEAKK